MPPVLLVALVLLLAPPALHPAQAAETDHAGAWAETYLDDSEAAAVYGTPADAIPPAIAGELLLELVNAARATDGLSALAWSDDAALTAQVQADLMAAGHYASHYDLDGRKVELRFRAIGATDHATENTSYYSVNRRLSLTPQLVRRMHQHWLTSPSHRRNVLDPVHTHLGAAFSLDYDAAGTHAAGAVVFVNDYGDYDLLPIRLNIGERIRLTGQLDPTLATLQYIGVGTEAWPEPRTVEFQRAHPDGYRQPKVTLALLPRQYLDHYRPDMSYRRYTAAYDPRTGEFSVEIHLDRIWPAAAYYITVWAVPNAGERLEPDSIALQAAGFRAMTQVVLVE